MRMLTILLCGVLVLSLAPTVGADVLKFANGGALKGNLQAATIFSNGKSVTCTRSQIEAVWVSAAAKDAITLKGGAKLTGELLSIKFRSIGGVLTFDRKDIGGFQFAADPLAAARKELAAKKGKLVDGDADALCELAAWCQEKGLKVDAVSLARAALRAGADGEAGNKAHQLVGHVKYQGKWMTMAEMAKLKAADGGGDDPVANPDLKPDPKPKDARLTAEQRQALKTAFAKNTEFRKAYLGKVDQLKEDDRGKLKETYGKEADALMSRLKGLRSTIEKKEAARERAQDEANEKLRNSLKQYKGTAGLLRKPACSRSLRGISRNVNGFSDTLAMAAVRDTRAVGTPGRLPLGPALGKQSPKKRRQAL